VEEAVSSSEEEIFAAEVEKENVRERCLKFCSFACASISVIVGLECEDSYGKKSQVRSDTRDATLREGRSSWPALPSERLQEGSSVVFFNLNQFFKENVRYPVWTCRDPISLILETQFSLILGTRFSILETRFGSLKKLEKTCFNSLWRSSKMVCGVLPKWLVAFFRNSTLKAPCSTYKKTTLKNVKEIRP